MPVDTYNATFSDGTTTTCRSTRPYTHAYRATGVNAYGRPTSCSAFSTSAERAAKSARSSFAQLTSTFDPKLRKKLAGKVLHVEIVETVRS